MHEAAVHASWHNAVHSMLVRVHVGWEQDGGQCPDLSEVVQPLLKLDYSCREHDALQRLCMESLLVCISSTLP